MKRFISRFTCILFALLALAGCDKNVDDSYPPFHYQYRLAVTDTEGNDLLAEVRTFQEPGSSLYIVVTGECAFDYIKPQDGYITSMLPGNKLYLEEKDGGRALWISLCIINDRYKLPKPETITHTLVSETIFHDKEVHRIESHWEFNDVWTEATLVRVSIDGKEAVIQPGSDEYNPLVTAILTDR